MNIVDLNLKVAMSFGILIVAFLLSYIAFFKNSPKPSKTK